MYAGTSELSSILQNVSPSVNYPRQSVTDADDIVRPFTMRGLSPDHTLVLVNGIRRHRSALVHTFAFGEPAGATGVHAVYAGGRLLGVAQAQDGCARPLRVIAPDLQPA